MADPNAIHPYNYGTNQANEFERKGHPGRYIQSITCGVGTTWFTGSNFGMGAFIVPTGSVGTASLSNGGDIPLGVLAQGGIRVYEISLSSVKVDSGIVYALIRNQNVR